MILATLLLALAQTTSTPPAGATPSPTPSNPTPADGKKHAKVASADRKTCRTYQMTGSLLGGGRECHTAREWAEIDARNSADTSAMRDRASMSPPR